MEKENNFKQGCLGCLVLIVIIAALIGGCSMVFGGDDEKEKEVDYSTLNKENVKLAIKDTTFGNEIYQKVKKVEIDKNDKVVVTIETSADHTVELKDLKQYLLDDLEALQKFKDIKIARVHFATKLKDKYGETSYEDVLYAQIEGSELRKIKFDNTGADDLNALVDFSFIHPIIK